MQEPKNDWSKLHSIFNNRKPMVFVNECGGSVLDSLYSDVPSMCFLQQRWMPLKCLATVSQHASQQPCSPVQCIYIRQTSMRIGLHQAFHLLQRKCFHWSNIEHVYSWSIHFTATLCFALCNCFFAAVIILAWSSSHTDFHNNACCRSLSTHFLSSSSCLFVMWSLTLCCHPDALFCCP